MITLIACSFVTTRYSVFSVPDSSASRVNFNSIISKEGNLFSTMSDFKFHPNRDSHEDFFLARDWLSIDGFWGCLMKSDSCLPYFITGMSNSNEFGFGITDLEKIHQAGKGQFISNNPRYARQTFAVRIGYHGTKYQGYQSQGKEDDIKTVQSDVCKALGRTVAAAGRTDRDVSAISQIISFHTHSPITPKEIIDQLSSSEAAQNGYLRAFECVRVPKKFQALFSATWRRYLFLFPCVKLENGALDVDFRKLNIILNKLEGLKLHYNGFAFAENRLTADGEGDVCQLSLARAFLVDLAQPQSDMTCIAAKDVVNETDYASETAALQSPTICVELVGDRFLRRMVRILVATAVREAVLPESQSDEDILLKICHYKARDRSAFALPGLGLAMCGVGYDIDDLAKDRYVSQNPDKVRKRMLKERAQGEAGEEVELPSTSSETAGDTSLVVAVGRQEVAHGEASGAKELGDGAVLSRLGRC